MFRYDNYAESAEFIRKKLRGFVPKYLMILGSGLGFLAERVSGAITVPYSVIPHFQSSTAPGHAGRFVCGTLGGKPVMIMQGRLHLYEGYTVEEVAYPVRTAKLLGAESLIVTNAVGGINLEYKVGDLVALNDFVRLNYFNPLTGPNIPEFGPRFPDMTYVFDREYLALIREIAREQSIVLREGCYFYATGPQYETPAEIRAFRTLGGDVVGMSAVHECITARHAGMRILGISLVTNMAAGVLDKVLTEKEVLDAAEAAKDPFAKLLTEFLERA